MEPNETIPPIDNGEGFDNPSEQAIFSTTAEGEVTGPVDSLPEPLADNGEADSGSEGADQRDKGGRRKGQKDAKPRYRRTRAEMQAEGKTTKPKPSEEPADKGTDNRSEFDEFLKEAKDYEPKEEPKQEEQKQTEPKPEPVQQVKPMISGYLLLIVIDTIAPGVVITVIGWVKKDVRDIKAEEIRLTDKQLQTLTPLADQVADIVFAKMHPINAFFISLAFCYAGNLMTVSTRRPKKIITPKTEDKEE